MQSDSDEATAKPSEPVWAGWALPVDADDKLLLSISAYASDVLAFTTAFLTRCGFVKMQRLAPTAVASESFKSLEDRNQIAVEDGKMCPKLHLKMFHFTYILVGVCFTWKF